MGRRSLTALVGGPLVLAITYFNGPVFVLTVEVAGVLGSYELAHMIRPRNWLTLALVVLTTLAIITAMATDTLFIIPLAIAIFLVVGLSAKGVPPAMFRRR